MFSEVILISLLQTLNRVNIVVVFALFALNKQMLTGYGFNPSSAHLPILIYTALTYTRFHNLD